MTDERDERDEKFTDHLDGTVTDNLTGLMWLKEANHIATNHPKFDTDGILGDGRVTWQHALNFVAKMNTGTYGNCGHTDWRLPNCKELRSLIDRSQSNPALPAGHPFANVVSYDYWSSSIYDRYTSKAWIVDIMNGRANTNYMFKFCCVWPVRGIKKD